MPFGRGSPHLPRALRIQSLFTSAELSAFRERVRAELVPNLAGVRRTWQSNRSSDQHADEHMKPLLESFSALKEEFVDDPAILGNIDHEIKLAREWIAEMDDEPKEDRPARTSTTLTSKTISDRRTLNLAASAGVLVFAGQSDAWRDAAKIFLPMPVQPKPV
jgi:hypothetical protein